MNEISEIRSALESVLLVIDEPAQVPALAQAVGADPHEVHAELVALREELDSRKSGIDLRVTDGGWRFYTRKDNAEAVEAFLLGGTQTKISRAAMETLAVIAYRQPVTRQQIAAVRGVSVDGVIKTLLIRGLIRQVAPDNESSGAHHFETTELFLELLGIDSLERLPDLAPLIPELDSIEEIS